METQPKKKYVNPRIIERKQREFANKVKNEFLINCLPIQIEENSFCYLGNLPYNLTQTQANKLCSIIQAYVTIKE